MGNSENRQRFSWLVVLSVFGLLLLGSCSPSQTSTRQAASEADEEPRIVQIESKLLFTGNSFWGRYIERAARSSDDPLAFPFARLHEFDRGSYDAWITGLECPVTEKGKDLSGEYMNETLVFNCDPEFVTEFAKWFDIVTLANNHTDNMGASGFAETKELLAANGIQHFGHYDPEKLDELCEVISIPIRATYSDGATRDAALPIAMCGHHGVYRVPSKQSIDAISQYSPYLPVIAMPHSGAEYKPNSDNIKQRSYRAMIDAGAQVVLGDHPHWVQNTEVHNGKLIVYSMGNFLFDQQGSLEVIRSAAISIDMKATELDEKSVQRWLEIGETCSTYQDVCLEQIRSENLTPLDFSFEYDVVATNNRGYQPHPDKKLLKGIKQRLNWDRSMKDLQIFD